MFKKTPECFLLFFIGCKSMHNNGKISFFDHIFILKPLPVGAYSLITNARIMGT